MGLGFLEGEHRSSLGLGFQKSRKQHEDSEALRSFTVSGQRDLCARRRPELHLRFREHVEHPAGYGLDGDRLARSHRDNSLHLAESGLHLLEAGVRRNDELIHLLELGFDLGLPVRRKLRVRQKGSPEWSLRIEVPGENATSISIGSAEEGSAPLSVR